MACISWGICIKNMSDFRLQIQKNKFNNIAQGYIDSIRNNIVYIKTSNNINAVCYLRDIDINKQNIGQKITFQYDISTDPLIKRMCLCHHRKYFCIKHINY